MTGPSIAERSSSGRGGQARVPVVYLDSSALVKLLIDEPESDDLERHLLGDDRRVWSSAIARVEVTRAVSVAAPVGGAGSEAEARLRAWKLVAVTDAVLADAAALSSVRLRSLDAIHLASARAIPADEFITYDGRLAEVARGHGMTVVQPGLGSRRDRAAHDRDA